MKRQLALASTLIAMLCFPLISRAQGLDEIVFATRNGKRGVLSIQKTPLQSNTFSLTLNVKWVNAELKPVNDFFSVVVIDWEKLRIDNPMVINKTKINDQFPIISSSVMQNLKFEIKEAYKGERVTIELPFYYAENNVKARVKNNWIPFAFSRPREHTIVYDVTTRQIVDKTPPRVNVLSPDGIEAGLKSLLDMESVKVAVSVQDYFGVENVLVNNRPTEKVNDTTFIATVPLKLNLENPVTILAVDKNGLTTKSQFTIDNRSSTPAAKVAAKQMPKSEPSDVDVDIPLIGKTDPNKFALIIGNEDYTTHQPHLRTESNVEFAVADAESFKQYALKLLGIPEANIMLLTNARAIEMHNALSQMNLITKNAEGNAEVYVYYAGHGFPDEKTQEPYLIPVDVSGANLNFAIKLSDFYAKLTEYPTKRTTVFIDACFSGGGRDQGLLAARAVKVRPKGPVITGNLVVFSATTGDQSALPWQEKQHGMFTYLLLSKLKQTQGNISYEELSDFLRTNVGTRSVMVNKKEQNPQTNISPTVIEDWKKWKFTK
jgi:hypothetical protein